MYYTTQSVGELTRREIKFLGTLNDRSQAKKYVTTSCLAYKLALLLAFNCVFLKVGIALQQLYLLYESQIRQVVVL